MRFLSLLLTIGLCCACDLEVIPDNFTGDGTPDEGAPVACFTVDRNACSADDCSLTFTAACAQRAQTYRWDFDGDGAFDQEGTAATAMHTYTNPGTFLARLEVQDGMNRLADTTMVVEVDAPALRTFAETDPTVQSGAGLALLDDGSYLLTGSVAQQIYLRRISTEGEILYNRTYSLPGVVTVRDLVVLSDGTYVIVGTYSDGGTKSFYARIAASGAAITGPVAIELPDEQSVTRVAEMPDGSLVFAATQQRVFTVGVDIVLTRMSANLNTLFWTTTLRGGASEFFSMADLVVTDDAILVAGSTFSSSLGARGLFARCSHGGTLAAGSPRYYSSASPLSFRAMITVEEELLVTGVISPGKDDIYLLRFDENGVPAAGYPKTLAEGGNQLVSDLALTNDGGAILAGGDEGNVLLVKIDADGAEQWRASRDLTGNSGYNRVVTAPDGGYFATGFRTESLYYAKTDAAGAVE